MRSLLLIYGLAAGCSRTAGDTAGSTADGHDTGASPCLEATVTFTPTGGAAQNLTEWFTTGDYLTLSVPGTLEICPGTWFSRVLVRADVEVRGLGVTVEDTVLSGGESGTILDVAGPDVTLSVHNIALDRGAGLDVEHNSGGGAVYCEQQGVVLATEVRFTNNIANDGSALYARDCVVELTHVELEGNVSDDDGGAMSLWTSTATLDNTRFVANRALDGGAVAMFESTMTTTSTTFEGNRATQFGGGVWAYNSTLSLTDTVFRDNVNDGGEYGGGLIVHGSATLLRTDFVDNSAPLGGGLFVYHQGVVDGTDCDFEGNEPEDIWASDGSASGGQAYTGGSGFDFACAENTCSGG